MMRDMRSAVVLFVLLSACERGGACSEASTPIAYADGTRSGESAEALMEAVGGEWQGVWSWNDKLGVAAPANSSVPVTFGITYTGGQVRFVDREVEDGAEDERLACSDELLIPVRLTLATGDGALKGEWDVDARHEVGGGLSLSLEIRPLVDYVGGFTATVGMSKKWDPTSEEVSLVMYFGAERASGTLTLIADSKDDEDMLLAPVAMGMSERP